MFKLSFRKLEGYPRQPSVIGLKYPSKIYMYLSAN